MAERADPRPNEPEGPATQTRVLQIEDDPGDAYLLQKMLADADESFALEREPSLTAGLERLAAGGFDALLLDLSLPDSDGLETFRKAHAHSPDVPIVVVTGLDDERLGVQAVREGAQDYLVKGQIDGRQLVRALRYAIERTRAEREHRRLFVRLLEARRMESLGAVAGRIGDDLSHLLLGILLNTELAIERLPADSPVHDLLGEARTATLRAAELSQQMQAYSGKKRLVTVPFDLSELVDEMRPLLEASVPRETRLEYNLGVNLPPADADAVQVRHALLGLVHGAEGNVTLSTGTTDCDRRRLAEDFHEDRLRSGRFVYLEIADDGPAVPEAARVYEADAGTELTGRALGLVTARDIVRRYYGALAVDSGETGTTVRVILPAAIPAARAERLTLSAGWHEGGTALVIEGDAAARTAVQRALERFGFDVVTADDDHRGLELLREHADDVRFVVMDAGATQAEPGEVLRRMHEIHDRLPVVLSDGSDPRRLEERFAGLDVAAVIRKPYRLAQLRETIRGILEGR